MSKAEWLVDFVVMPGVVDVLDKLNTNASFYLVCKNGKQYLVKVSDDFIVTNELAELVDEKKFVIGNYQYKKLYQLI